ncbi:MAG: YgdI/YgdR family lipoprotein [Blautia sp.]|nr:YgdI/YgdR family lipoprotein [Blautia sp.]
MRRMKRIVLAVLLCAGLLAGCGQSYEAETNTVFVLKDGRIVSTDVEAFDTAAYDEAGLKAYIESAISAYTGANGKDSVILKELTVEEGTATLILEYASAEAYAGFNGIELYVGSVASALSVGYSFDGEFAAVKNGTPTLCQVSEFLGSDYKVAIIRGNTNVCVAGDVAYVSTENTSYVDSSTISVQTGNYLLGQAADTGSTQEEAAETVDGTEAVSTETEETEIDESALSDSDEDLLAVSQEETEVVFDFGEETKEKESAGEFSEVYTYIVYK